jgi:hypothetical protein
MQAMARTRQEDSWQVVAYPFFQICTDPALSTQMLTGLPSADGRSSREADQWPHQFQSRQFAADFLPVLGPAAAVYLRSPWDLEPPAAGHPSGAP